MAALDDLAITALGLVAQRVEQAARVAADPAPVGGWAGVEADPHQALEYPRCLAARAGEGFLRGRVGRAPRRPRAVGVGAPAGAAARRGASRGAGARPG